MTGTKIALATLGPTALVALVYQAAGGTEAVKAIVDATKTQPALMLFTLVILAALGAFFAVIWLLLKQSEADRARNLDAWKTVGDSCHVAQEAHLAKVMAVTTSATAAIEQNTEAHQKTREVLAVVQAKLGGPP